MQFSIKATEAERLYIQKIDSLHQKVELIPFGFGYYEHGYRPFDHSVPENTVEYAHTMAFIALVM